VRGSDSSESIQTRPSQGPRVSVLLHHCHRLLNELRLGETFFYLPPGAPEACSPEQFNARGSGPLFLEVPVVLLTLQIAGGSVAEQCGLVKYAAERRVETWTSLTRPTGGKPRSRSSRPPASQLGKASVWASHRGRILLKLLRANPTPRTMKEPDEQPDDFDQIFWATYEETWTKTGGDEFVANISVPPAIREILEAYATERGLETADLLSLAIDGGYVKAALNNWSGKVAALANDPDLIDWPLDDPLTCIGIALMRHLAIQSMKKWCEKHGDGSELDNFGEAMLKIPPEDVDQLREEATREMHAAALMGAGTPMVFPPEVLERIHAHEQEHSIDRNHLIPLAMKYTQGRTEEVVELMNRLLKDPEAFEWPIDDPLLCVALAFMRSSSSWITRKINEEYGEEGDGEEDDDNQADYWKESEP
jgi:hypothetical protein